MKIRCYCLGFFLIFSYSVSANTTTLLSLSDGAELTILKKGSTGESLLIWIHSEVGPQAIHSTLTALISKQSVEVWQVDLLEARFLPLVASSLDKIPASDISSLIHYARQQTRKPIYIITSGRGVIPVLRGSHHWQVEYPNDMAIAGVILISPKLYIEIPDVGKAAELMPIVKSTNLPIFLLQPDKSPWYWKLNQIMPALEKTGSDLFVRIIRGVRDRFYFRPDAMKIEQQITKKLPLFITEGMNLLASLPLKRRLPALIQGSAPVIIEGKKTRHLQPYPGMPKAPDLVLESLDGSIINLTHFKNRVVLVNFWATWCPPCVHEMPSMQRLIEKLSGQSFDILGVNIAEQKQSIQRFLAEKVNVQFPILLDKDGEALQRWGVFAFPTSFVIDKKGRLRYGLSGSVDWSSVAMVNKLRKLTEEP